MKSDFINNITHEFNTPITAILVANRNIQNEKTLENKQSIQALSTVIHRQAERLKLLMEKVVDVAATEQLTLKPAATDLDGLIGSIVTVYSLNYPDTIFRFQHNNETLLIVTDSFHFTTLLQNILDNGMKYNDQPHKEISITLLSHNGELDLVIKDNGIGMNAHTRQHIFEKFYRHQPRLSRPTKGLGLGLYYVKQCVEAHGWSIRVFSEPGEGSSFVITIPYKIQYHETSHSAGRG